MLAPAVLDALGDLKHLLGMCLEPTGELVQVLRLPGCA